MVATPVTVADKMRRNMESRMSVAIPVTVAANVTRLTAASRNNVATPVTVAASVRNAVTNLLRVAAAVIVALSSREKNGCFASVATPVAVAVKVRLAIPRKFSTKTATAVIAADTTLKCRYRVFINTNASDATARRISVTPNARVASPVIAADSRTLILIFSVAAPVAVAASNRVIASWNFINVAEPVATADLKLKCV